MPARRLPERSNRQQSIPFEEALQSEQYGYLSGKIARNTVGIDWLGRVYVRKANGQDSMHADAIALAIFRRLQQRSTSIEQRLHIASVAINLQKVYADADGIIQHASLLKRIIYYIRDLFNSLGSWPKGMIHSQLFYNCIVTFTPSQRAAQSREVFEFLRSRNDDSRTMCYVAGQRRWKYDVNHLRRAYSFSHCHAGESHSALVETLA